MIRLKQLREELGISQTAFSKQIGFGQSTVSNWEKGVRVLDVNTATTLANFFEVSVDYLIGNSDIRSQEKPAETTLLSSHEDKVITAYRDKPAMQPAVDTLLGVEAENKVIDGDDYFSGELFALPADETPKSHLQVADDFSAPDSWYDQNS